MWPFTTRFIKGTLSCFLKDFPCHSVLWTVGGNKLLSVSLLLSILLSAVSISNHHSCLKISEILKSVPAQWRPLLRHNHHTCGFSHSLTCWTEAKSTLSIKGCFQWNWYICMCVYQSWSFMSLTSDLWSLLFQSYCKCGQMANTLSNR